MIISYKSVYDALDAIKNHTLDALLKKGHGSFVSSHEILGTLAEEYHEVIEAVKLNDLRSIRDELLDVATVCHFAIACIDDEALHWPAPETEGKL